MECGVEFRGWIDTVEVWEENCCEFMNEEPKIQTRVKDNSKYGNGD